jgi:hypothetical protein
MSGAIWRAGFFVAWLILKRDAWIGYLLGLIVIGIADLAFLFADGGAGVIEFDARVPSGGLCCGFWRSSITPFGLPPRRRT